MPENLMATLTLFGPLLLAISACVLAIAASAAMLNSTTSLQLKINGLGSDSVLLSQRIADLPPIPPPPVVVVLPAAPAPPSPLQIAINDRLAWLDNFALGLRNCSLSTGLSIPDLTSGAWPPRAIQASLAAARTPQDIKAAEQEIIPLARKIVQDLLSRCDLDLDPLASHPSGPSHEGRNAQLQKAIAWLAEEAGLKLFRPETGDPFDPRLHDSIGVEPHTAELAPQLRGTVASVRARGLLDRTGAVVARAEVREYD